MTRNDLEPLIIFAADQMYKYLVSLPKSEEMSIKYHQMEISKQKLTEKNFKKFSRIYAELLVQKVMIDKKAEKVAIREALEEALERLNDEKKKK